MASKSLSDLESLVDQIPSIAESGGQRLGHLGGEESLAEKLESGAHQSYLSAYASGPQPNYSPPLSLAQSGMYDGGYSSPAYGMANSRQHTEQSPHSKSYSVENLASSNYTPSSMSQQSQPMQQQYSNMLAGPHYPVPVNPSSNNGYLFSGLESSLMQRGYPPMPGAHHPSLHGHHPMGNPYSYNSPYASSFDAYSAPSPGPTIHAPQPTYQGYPHSPGGASSTTPPSYLQQAQSRQPVDLAYDAV